MYNLIQIFVELVARYGTGLTLKQLKKYHLILGCETTDVALHITMIAEDTLEVAQVDANGKILEVDTWGTTSRDKVKALVEGSIRIYKKQYLGAR